jgi:hypothetical protein
MNNIYKPITDPEQWRALLADPEKHWRRGYSARTLAYSWQESNGFPGEVERVLRASGRFHDIERLICIPEHQVPLPGGAHASQSDIWVLARTGAQLVSIAVEGKVDEPFDKPVSEWLTDEPRGKEKRLAFLAGKLGLEMSSLGNIRYQLLHRTVSAILMADKFRAQDAVMLVHSFSQTHEHFDDFRRFVNLFNCDVTPDRLVSVGEREGVNLHFAWVTGNPEYLMK